MFTGSIVALVTPFTEHGEIDFPSVDALIEWHIAEGTNAIVLCGTTGESPTLHAEEKEALFKRAARQARGRISLIAGTGTHSTSMSVALTKMAKKEQMDAAIVVVPYYNRPTPEGCIRHYQEISKVELPLIVYHHPGRTGVWLSTETLASIASLPGVVGIKEASGNIEFAEKLIKSTEVPVFCGDDVLTPAMMQKGARGSISIVANLVPKEWKEVCAADVPTAHALYDELRLLCEAMVLETNPQCVKYALSLMGKCTPRLRLPLIEPREENKARIREAIAPYANACKNWEFCKEAPTI